MRGGRPSDKKPRIVSDRKRLLAQTIHDYLQHPLRVRLSSFTRSRFSFGFLIRRSRFGRRAIQSSKKWRFRANKYRYLGKQRAESIKLAGSSMRDLFRLAVAPVLCALAVFPILVLISDVYQFVRHWFPRGIPPLPQVDKNIHYSIVGTIAQSAAAILALFFTAISVVASTGYAKLASDVRLLIINDDLNRRYLRLLAHLAAVSVIALIWDSLGHEPKALPTLYIGVLAVISFLCFFGLGARTFALFSPLSLLRHPIRTFFKQVNSVTPVGKRWLDPSFQAHARKVATRQLEIIEELLEAALSDEHPSMKRVVHEMTTEIHHMARFYSRKKAGIPARSEWFAKKPEFSRLQASMGTEVEIALATGVVTPSAPVPDHYEIERRFDGLLGRCLVHTLESNNTADAVAQLLETHKTAIVRSTVFQHSEATAIARSTANIILSWLKRAEPGDSTLARLQVVDVTCVVAITPILDTPRILCGLPVDAPFAPALPLLQGDTRAIHMAYAPQSLIEDLEDILSRIDFERAVEDQVVTKKWYVEQLIADSYAKLTREIATTISNVLASLFLEFPRELLGAGREVDASVWLQRSIEACNKADSQLRALESFYARLKERHATESPWYEWDHRSQNEIRDVRRQVVLLICDCMPKTLHAVGNDTLPDVVGHSRLWIADELLTIMESKAVASLEQYGKLFSAYFNSTLAVSGDMFGVARRPGKSDYGRAALDAMLDLLEMSGMAILFSELDGTPFRKLVEAIWDAYLDRLKDQTALIVDAWMGPLKTKLGLPTLSASSRQRFNWGQRLAEALRNRGAASDDDYPYRRPSTLHSSPIIRSLQLHRGYMFGSPADYFAATYFAPRADAYNISLPHSVEDCRRGIKRETDRNSRG